MAQQESVLRRVRMFSLESGGIFRVSEPSAFLVCSRHLGYGKQTFSELLLQASVS